ncbi:hypothetical protein V8F06_004938 [Rhypophila decipiens]
MAPLHGLVALLGLVATNVLAGSPIWESKLNHPEHVVQHDQVPIDSAGYAIVGEQEPSVTNILKRSENRKRWIAENENGASRDTSWPDRTIKYCFETQRGRQLLGKYVSEAIKMWDAAGLRKDRYKIEEVPAVGSACVNHPNVKDFLVIRFRPYKGGLGLFGGNSASVGKVTDPDEQSTMDISFTPGVTGGKTAGDIAHEFGHVWGLEHEMQNPGFWDRRYGPYPGPHLTNENSQNATDKLLADQDRGGLTPDDLCKNWHVANNYGFVMGVQWLPLPNEGSFHSPHQPGGLDYNHVDWESVMLYDSLHFGTPILLRNDGERFRANFKPSAGDVHGVKRIYGEREETILEHSFPDLPHQATSGFWGRLREKVDDQLMKAIGCAL